ncbi:hypothetical protein CMUS01_13587 [Colletotrichum musicola]|uniref:Uncharacterized protein n=1 Tax=Colletotrichum musicola TaxID=2175873 RepID=A0A8H6JC66_9PEZI|nr:hypothetical protein CMUS01_13587 [Colletotrichum musicola]
MAESERDGNLTRLVPQVAELRRRDLERTKELEKQRAVKYAEEPDTQLRQAAEQAQEILRLRTRVDKSTDVVVARHLRSHHPPAKSSSTTSNTREHATVRGDDPGLRRLVDGPSLTKKPRRAAAVQERRWTKLALRKQATRRDSAAL